MPGKQARRISATAWSPTAAKAIHRRSFELEPLPGIGLDVAFGMIQSQIAWAF